MKRTTITVMLLVLAFGCDKRSKEEEVELDEDGHRRCEKLADCEEGQTCYGRRCLTPEEVAAKEEETAASKQASNVAEKTEPKSATETKAADEKAADKKATPEKKSKWVYNEFKDPMTSGTTKTARITSENRIELDFPYQGGTYAEIMLRKDPREGTDMMLSISKGQIVCHSFMGCKIAVRFDEKKAINFRVNEPADHSNDAIFLVPGKKFVAAARGAKRVVIEIPLYDAGSPVFEFDIEGLTGW